MAHADLVVLNGIRFEIDGTDSKCVSTDRNRLSICKLNAVLALSDGANNAPFGFTLPERAVRTLFATLQSAKIEENVSLGYADGWTIWRIGKTEICAKTVNERFPN
jgi:DNA polymerase III sliding clamp (beta) subunit (PCNA family)